MDSRTGQPDCATRHEALVIAERRTYDECLEVHRLPDIFHYWSNEHLLPLLLPFGFTSPTDFFAKSLYKQCKLAKTRPIRFVSLGSGNCDLEVELAGKLVTGGSNDFVIECIDLNPTMLDRGREAAAAAGLAGRMRFTQADINTWVPESGYDGVIANQFLHHVVSLEHLFAQVKTVLRPNGSFIISDMIGRNGHQRWPEALSVVYEFWSRLPPSYRVNHQLGCYEEVFEDWDCSVEGFEGIRSQDILPLLTANFHFRFFFAFGNLIDPFIDRSFGPNFDAASGWDRRFIDQVHRRDEAELCSGRLKPTHMMAVVGNDNLDRPVFRKPLSPEFSIRPPELAGTTPESPGHDAYPLAEWPRDPQQELEILCRRLGGYSGYVRERTARLSQMERELEERTAWARSLTSELEACRQPPQFRKRVSDSCARIAGRLRHTLQYYLSHHGRTEYL